MEFPLTLTKGKEKAKVYHAPDLQGWLDDGWEIEGATKPKTEKPVKPTKDLSGLDF